MRIKTSLIILSVLSVMLASALVLIYKSTVDLKRQQVDAPSDSIPDGAREGAADAGSDFTERVEQAQTEEEKMDILLESMEKVKTAEPATEEEKQAQMENLLESMEKVKTAEPATEEEKQQSMESLQESMDRLNANGM